MIAKLEYQARAHCLGPQTWRRCVGDAGVFNIGHPADLEILDLVGDVYRQSHQMVRPFSATVPKYTGQCATTTPSSCCISARCLNYEWFLRGSVMLQVPERSDAAPKAWVGL